MHKTLWADDCRRSSLLKNHLDYFEYCSSKICCFMCGTKQKRQSLRVLELPHQLHYHYIDYLHGVLIGLRFIKRNTLDIVISAKLCLIHSCFASWRFHVQTLPCGRAVSDWCHLHTAHIYIHFFCLILRITRIDFLKEINDSGMKFEIVMHDWLVFESLSTYNSQVANIATALLLNN